MSVYRPGDRFFLVGGGIASMAAAAFLIRDVGVPGEQITVIAADDRPGGALVSGRAERRPALVLGNAVRHMDAAASACLHDLLWSVPTLTDSGTTVIEETVAEQGQSGIAAEVRLVDRGHRIRNPDREEATATRRRLLRLLGNSPDEDLLGRRIDEVVPGDVLDSDFWLLWSNLYRLRPASSALDLRTTLLRHSDRSPLPALYHSRRSEYESIIRPLQQWLRARGVAYTCGATVEDMEIVDDGAEERRVTRLRLVTRDRSNDLELGPRDYVLATLGSLAADAAHGDDDEPARADPAHRDGTWRLWESLAGRQPDFGRPDAFTSHAEDTAWLSFTLTTTTPDLNWHAGRLVGGGRGDGVGLVTFRDSPWLLTLAVPRQPYFTGQWPARTVLGYGTRLDRGGEYVPVTMREADGRQLLDEVIGQIGIERGQAAIRMHTNSLSTLLPYACSPVAPRAAGDRPEPVPAGARNFAFLGQYVEIPGDVAFSMEYSVRSAMLAVYELLGVEREVPAPCRAG